MKFSIHFITISSAIFPDFLKVTRVVPVHIPLSRERIRNYRSISAINKVFEKLIKNRFIDFFIRNLFIGPQQFGFVKGKGIQDEV